MATKGHRSDSHEVHALFFVDIILFCFVKNHVSMMITMQSMTTIPSSTDLVPIAGSEFDLINGLSSWCGVFLQQRLCIEDHFAHLLPCRPPPICLSLRGSTFPP